MYGAIGSAGASSPGNVWVFTTSDTGESDALRFDGRRWTNTGRSTLGASPGLTNGLVLGRHHVWAFGDDGRDRSWFWDGHTWHKRAPGHRRAPKDIRRTSAVSQKDVWAIDGCDAAHFDGKAWKKAALGGAIPPSTGESDTCLTGVLAVAKDDVWVSGEISEGDAADGRVVAAHFDGRTWSRVDVPLPAATAPPRQPWRLGDAVPDGRGGIRMIAYPPDDTTSRVLSRSAAGQWSVSVPQVDGKVIDLWDLALIPGTTEVWAAGTVRQSETDSTSAIFALKGPSS
jgi:hypothetical protein